MKRGAAGKKKKEARRRQGGRSRGEEKSTTDNGDLRVDGEGRWQRMKLYTHNDPAALYRADKAAWQQMKVHEADPYVVAYQEIRLQGKDKVVCAQVYDKEGREYQRSTCGETGRWAAERRTRGSAEVEEGEEGMLRTRGEEEGSREVQVRRGGQGHG